MIQSYFMFGVPCAVVAALIARSKGQNIVGPFLLGFFLGIFGILIVLAMSDREKFELERRLRKERQLLREKLRQEKMENELSTKMTNARMEVHDEAFGLNTHFKTPPESDVARDDSSLLPPMKTKWYYREDNETKGPVGDEIQDMIGSVRQDLYSSVL